MKGGIEMAEIHFNHIFEINQILKKNHIDYTLHSNGGCSSCGVHLICEGEEKNIHDIIYIINDYLKDKWLKVRYSHDLYLDVLSLFD